MRQTQTRHHRTRTRLMGLVTLLATTIAVSLAPVPAGAAVAQAWVGLAPSGSTASVLSATALADGRVLTTAWPDGASRIYDSAANTWTIAGVSGTLYDESSLIGDGRVVFVNDGRVYDPATNAWSTVTIPDNFLFGSKAENERTVTLNSGKMLAVGGHRYSRYPGFQTSLFSPQDFVFDPVTKAWTATSAPDRLCYTPGLTVLSNGDVLVSGGAGQGDPHATNTASIYHPATNTWTPTGSMATARLDHATARLADGRVLALAVRTTSRARGPSSPPRRSTTR